MGQQKIRKAVFPVAGLGTRFLPATKAVPKEMLTVVDKPVIQYVVDEAAAPFTPALAALGDHRAARREEGSAPAAASRVAPPNCRSSAAMAGRSLALAETVATGASGMPPPSA